MEFALKVALVIFCETYRSKCEAARGGRGVLLPDLVASRHFRSGGWNSRRSDPGIIPTNARNPPRATLDGCVGGRRLVQPGFRL